MSALSAIESPVPAGPDAADAILRERERRLALVRPAADRGAQGGSAGANNSGEPRSSSITADSGPGSESRPRSASNTRRVLEAERVLETRQVFEAQRVFESQRVHGTQRVRESQRVRETQRVLETQRVRSAVGSPTVATVAAVRPRAEVARSPIRLTRRGRLVVGVLAVAVLTVAVLLITLAASGRAQATNHGQAGAGYRGMREIVVQPGQTLWSIASAAEPTADPRAVVQEIMTANAMTSTTISAGQLLWVPR
jgi:hypothetical protein